MTKSEYRTQEALGTLPLRQFKVKVFRESLPVHTYICDAVSCEDAKAKYIRQLYVWNERPLASFYQGAISMGAVYQVIQSLEDNDGEFTIKVQRSRAKK